MSEPDSKKSRTQQNVRGRNQPQTRRKTNNQKTNRENTWCTYKQAGHTTTAKATTDEGGDGEDEDDDEEEEEEEALFADAAVSRTSSS